MSTHDCNYNCGSTDCEAPDGPRRQASSGNSELLLREIDKETIPLDVQFAQHGPRDATGAACYAI